MNDSTKVYRIGKGWKVFIPISAILMCGLFVWLTYYFYVSTASLPFIFGVSLISLGMISMAIFGVVDIFVAKLTITDNGIFKVNSLGAKAISFQEVQGIKTNKDFVFVFPKSSGKRILRISKYFEKRYEWEWILESHFANLDELESIAEQETLESDKAFGKSQCERGNHISRAKSRARFLNYSSGAVTLWLLFYPYPYELATSLALLLPLTGLYLIVKSKGLIRIIGIEDSPYPSLSSTITFPFMAIVCRAALDYNIHDYNNAWIYAVCLMPIILLVFKIGSRDFKEFRLNLEAVFICSFLAVTIGVFGFFSSIMINCTFDFSSPDRYEVIILDKNYTRSSKGIETFSLTLELWGKNKENSNIRVPEEEFRRLEKGDKVNLYLHPGLLNIPWEYIVVEDE